MKALVINERWIPEILKGDKTLAMRKKNSNSHRQVARIAKVRATWPELPILLIVNRPSRGAPTMPQQSSNAGYLPRNRRRRLRKGWRTPRARPLQNAMRYKRPGAVWVERKLDDTTQRRPRVIA
jgi:hypothetical protein